VASLSPQIWPSFHPPMADETLRCISFLYISLGYIRFRKPSKKDRNGIGLEPRKALIRLCLNYLFTVDKALGVVVNKIKTLALQTSLLRPRLKQVTERYTRNAVERSTSVV